jgi:acetolactate synthase I/II/III large subunit
LPRIIAEAFYIAATGRPGPVLIDIPKDVGMELFDYIPIEPGAVKPTGYRPTVTGNPRQVKKALDLFKTATRPLLYVGGGAIAADSHDQIETLANLFQIPVTTTLMGKGIFDETHPLALGMLGMHGTAYANFAVSECDLLIAVGARFDDRVASQPNRFAKDAKIIHIDIDPAEMGKNLLVEVPIVGDVKQVLVQILDLIEKENIQPDNNQTKAWREHLYDSKN